MLTSPLFLWMKRSEKSKVAGKRRIKSIDGLPYNVTLKRSAIKALAQVDEPHYTRLKDIIYKLAEDPRPQGYKKLKLRDGFRIRLSQLN